MEALKGIDVILLYRLLKKETQEAAWKMAFQTEHENGLSRDSDSTVTKDGNVQSLSPVEYDFSATSIVAKGDSHVDEMKQALLNGKISERHARSLLSIESKEKQRYWLNRIINERLTVRQLDVEIKKEQNSAPEDPLISITPNIENIKNNFKIYQIRKR